MQLVVCPGSFDPIHRGHVDIISRAARIYGQVLVAVSHNSQKRYRFSLEERLALVEQTFAQVEGVRVLALPEGKLLAEFVQEQGSSVLLKGLRNTVDFEYEAPMASMNRHLSQVETVFLVGDPRFNHLSSSMIKEVASLGGDVSPFLPEPVLRALYPEDELGSSVVS